MHACVYACMHAWVQVTYVIHCVQTQSVFIMLANKEMVCVCVCVSMEERVRERVMIVSM